jgi:hypothetical protein
MPGQGGALLAFGRKDGGQVIDRVDRVSFDNAGDSRAVGDVQRFEGTGLGQVALRLDDIRGQDIRRPVHPAQPRGELGADLARGARDHDLRRILGHGEPRSGELNEVYL